MSHGESTATGRDPAPCIVLTPPGGVISEGLRADVLERGWRPESIDDPWRAMTQVCLCVHAESARRARGGNPPRALSFVFQASVAMGPDADGTSNLNHLVAALRRYAPSVAIWCWDDHVLRQLSPGAKPASLPSAPALIGPPAATPPRAAAGLQLTESMPVPGQPAVAHEDRNDDPFVGELEGETDSDLAAATRVTADEIEMLFAPVPEEAPQP